MISCLLLTADRRRFIPGAVQRFLEQDYPDRELLILDDGVSPVADLVPKDERIRYFRLPSRSTVGAKRNLGCQYARGEFIAHWDDDDWMATWRLSYQMGELLRFGADLCGLRQIYFWGPDPGQAWEYIYEADSMPWVAGGDDAVSAGPVGGRCVPGCECRRRQRIRVERRAEARSAAG
jgi:glycosyltransferase involved in cell wall biosynthesis